MLIFSSPIEPENTSLSIFTDGVSKRLLSFIVAVIHTILVIYFKFGGVVVNQEVGGL